jgi:hypothetical protein
VSSRPPHLPPVFRHPHVRCTNEGNGIRISSATECMAMLPLVYRFRYNLLLWAHSAAHMGRECHRDAPTGLDGHCRWVFDWCQSHRPATWPRACNQGGCVERGGGVLAGRTHKCMARDTAQDRSVAPTPLPPLAQTPGSPGGPVRTSCLCQTRWTFHQPYPRRTAKCWLPCELWVSLCRCLLCIDRRLSLSFPTALGIGPFPWRLSMLRVAGFHTGTPPATRPR